MYGPDFVSYKGSSQLNLRFHRLFCIYCLFHSSFHSFVRLYVFFGQFTGFWTMERVCFMSFLCLNKKKMVHGLSMVSIEMNVQIETEHTKAAKMLKFHTNQKNCFYCSSPKKQTHGGTAATAKANKWISPLVYCFLKFGASSFCRFLIRRRTWTEICIEHPNKRAKKWRERTLWLKWVIKTFPLQRLNKHDGKKDPWLSNRGPSIVNVHSVNHDWNSLPDSSCSGGSPFKWYAHRTQHIHSICLMVWLFFVLVRFYYCLEIESTFFCFYTWTIFNSSRETFDGSAFIYFYLILWENHLWLLSMKLKRGSEKMYKHTIQWCENNSMWEFLLNTR